ncbi:hypothetical protein LQ954_05550 [Sphingomonas sp. IC-11]|uniref:hypothetical protein n=2 Tax=unclassified Sphingomonas TaxID=196159 RepID=UPI001E2DB406|nr:hypothetical protein [Sphingomonas sp. IC-11]MCD2315611.1 hypothetical protein [Sphingomonas sp. IC-11]
MMGHEHHTGERGGGGYYVPRPRVTDAVGESLRYAYAETRRVPDELARILAQLDRLTTQH